MLLESHQRSAILLVVAMPWTRGEQFTLFSVVLASFFWGAIREILAQGASEKTSQISVQGKRASPNPDRLGKFSETTRCNKELMWTINLNWCRSRAKL